ncbi:hypothetical protein SDD30_14090 [Moorella naiadis]|uniref:hypothetical protein n=1 Tax=Moorella naiadis (nom. illeg.) TaxID=3093670 RepID=UPI003D9C92E8
MHERLFQLSSKVAGRWYGFAGCSFWICGCRGQNFGPNSRKHRITNFFSDRAFNGINGIIMSTLPHFNRQNYYPGEKGRSGAECGALGGILCAGDKPVGLKTFLLDLISHMGYNRSDNKELAPGGVTKNLNKLPLWIKHCLKQNKEGGTRIPG